MKMSEQGFQELKASEAFRAFAYPDIASELHKAYPRAGWGFKPAADILATLPASAQTLDGAPWTVGYGQTVGIKPDSYLTLAAAEINLRATVGKYEQAVLRACTITPTQGQFDALVSIAWNVMSAVSSKSSIIKAHNRGDWQAASRAFGLYNKAKGKVEKGLTLRRAREGAAYLAASPVDYEDVAIAPTASQDVDKERSMAKSQINVASTVAGGTSALAAAAETVKTVAAIKTDVVTLSDWAVPILLVAVVCLCVYIVLQRNKQRSEGWA